MISNVKGKDYVSTYEEARKTHLTALTGKRVLVFLFISSLKYY